MVEFERLHGMDEVASAVNDFSWKMIEVIIMSMIQIKIIENKIVRYTYEFP